MPDFRTHDSTSAVDDEPNDSFTTTSGFRAFDIEFSMATRKGVISAGKRVRALDTKQAIEAFVARMEPAILETADFRHPMTLKISRIL